MPDYFISWIKLSSWKTKIYGFVFLEFRSLSLLSSYLYPPSGAFSLKREKKEKRF